jgi:hypothetical protein
MQCRLELAALHFNENSNCEQAVTKEGDEQYDVVFPKYKKGGYIVRKVVEKPTYGYIQELLRKAVELCEREETEQSSSILPEPLSSGYDHPHKAEAIRRHKSRFKNI